MSSPNTEKWKSVKVPKGLSERIDEFVDSQKAYRLGLMSNSQVVAYAIREFLQEDDEIDQIRKRILKTLSRIEQKESSEHEPIQ
ncbi:ribbon-helix-helix domain-containing protein [Candidatus Nitrosopelagicus sp.]|nr:ribbon-helix-helix domain-containing protein [Candidatus Nitrosopelagicus sp.]